MSTSSWPLFQLLYVCFLWGASMVLIACMFEFNGYLLISLHDAAWSSWVVRTAEIMDLPRSGVVWAHFTISMLLWTGKLTVTSNCLVASTSHFGFSNHKMITCDCGNVILFAQCYVIRNFKKYGRLLTQLFHHWDIILYFHRQVIFQICIILLVINWAKLGRCQQEMFTFETWWHPSIWLHMTSSNIDNISSKMDNFGHVVLEVWSSTFMAASRKVDDFEAWGIYPFPEIVAVVSYISSWRPDKSHGSM